MHRYFISRTFRRISFRVDTYISPIMIRVCINTARSKGQGQQNKHRRFLKRSNEVMEFSINIARSKGQGQNHRRFLERSNEVMEFSINIARSKGQDQTWKLCELKIYKLEVCK